MAALAKFDLLLLRLLLLFLLAIWSLGVKPNKYYCPSKCRTLPGDSKELADFCVTGSSGHTEGEV